jgi:four helix bundle protein
MREKARTFQDLLVWQKSHQFVLGIYKMTDNSPQKEIYGLTSQLRGSAVSIPANIAEGFKKTGGADKARYLNIAQASLEETRYYLILAQDLGYPDCSERLSHVDEIGRLLGAYCNSLLRSIGKRP